MLKIEVSEDHAVACLYRNEIQKLNKAIARRNAKIRALRARVKMLVAIMREQGFSTRREEKALEPLVLNGHAREPVMYFDPLGD